MDEECEKNGEVIECEWVNLQAQGQSLRFGKIEKLMTESKMIVKSRSGR